MALAGFPGRNVFVPPASERSLAPQTHHTLASYPGSLGIRLTPSGLGPCCYYLVEVARHGHWGGFITSHLMDARLEEINRFLCLGGVDWTVRQLCWLGGDRGWGSYLICPKTCCWSKAQSGMACNEDFVDQRCIP